MPFRRRSAEEAAKAGPRWRTVATSDQEDVAKRLAGSYDNAKKREEMTARKLANTRTSISFGNEVVNYQSDAKANQAMANAGSTPAERAAQKQRIKQMKADLTVTNFALGDERPEYESVNHAAMAEAERFKGTSKVTMNKDVKEAVKKSSLHFGNEPVTYRTVGMESMQYHGNENNFAKLKQEVKEMTTTLRAHNFSFGDEKVAYVTDYVSGYGSVPGEAYTGMAQRKQAMKNTVSDMRACHFSLGNDAAEYMSNTQKAYEAAGGEGVTETIKRDRENAKMMSAGLRKTSIVIGDDPDYM